jgi:hypothetical protein
MLERTVVGYLYYQVPLKIAQVHFSIVQLYLYSHTVYSGTHEVNKLCGLMVVESRDTDILMKAAITVVLLGYTENNYHDKNGMGMKHTAPLVSYNYNLFSNSSSKTDI